MTIGDDMDTFDRLNAENSISGTRVYMHPKGANDRIKELESRLTEAKSLLLKVLPELSLALRQWRMFSDESKENRDIDHDRDTEAEWYRRAVEVRGELQKAIDG